MSPLTASLLVCAALLAVSHAMPTSNFVFPDTAQETRWVAPRFSRHRSHGRRHGGGRIFFFPGETVTVTPPDSPAVTADDPPVTDDPGVTTEGQRGPPDSQRHTTDTQQGATHSQRVTPDRTGSTSDSQWVTLDSQPAIPDSQPATPDREWKTSDSPEAPSDSGAVIEDRPVPRPNSIGPSWPPRTPGRTDDVPPSETEASSQSVPVSTAAPATSGGGGGIAFPDRAVPRRPVPQCGGELYHAYDNSTGECQKLWQGAEAGCADGSWFVVDPDSGDAVCRPRVCADGHALFDGLCWPTGENGTGPCAAGQGVFIDQFGVGFCDCLARQVFWPSERRCYRVYRRGPCPAGQHLAVPQGARAAACRPTPCPDGEVFWGEEGLTPRACYSLEEPEEDDWQEGEVNPCLGGQLEVDIYTLEVKCVQFELHAVFDPPKVRCPKGSQLDFNGSCRDELFQKFRASFHVMIENRSLCPPGFTATPNGRCVNSDLGLGLAG